MIGAAMWGVSVLAVVGVVLNIKKRRECFLIWAFTNAAWCAYDWWLGAPAQSALFAVYFILALWGIAEWRKAPQGRQ